MLGLADFDRIVHGVTLIGLLVGYEGGRRTVVGGYANIGFQLAVLLYRQSVELCKVLRTVVDAASRTVLVDIPHLPGLQAQS